MIYEAHITITAEFSQRLIALLEDGAFKAWKFSQIHGDITLGDKLYCYLTKHSRDVFALKQELDQAANSLRSHFGFLVVREKIEAIIYDTKQVTRD